MYSSFRREFEIGTEDDQLGANIEPLQFPSVSQMKTLLRLSTMKPIRGYYLDN